MNFYFYFYFLLFRDLANNSVVLQPGHFEEWVKDKTAEFRRLADAGDLDAMQVVEEIKSRPEFASN